MSVELEFSGAGFVLGPLSSTKRYFVSPENPAEATSTGAIGPTFRLVRDPLGGSAAQWAWRCGNVRIRSAAGVPDPSQKPLPIKV